METIRLQNGEWSYDPADPLGTPGGFGEVFRGVGPDGPVAVKRLKISAAAAAHRELTIGGALSSRNLGHVVPVLDYGQDAESERYFLVMPVCDRSLQDEIKRRGVLPIHEVRSVTLEILAGLQEVRDLVHRDLKPPNILFLDGAWRIADFGIAKFVEDSTSLETLRGILTPDYGAPEQWEDQRPTSATDVYALACIVHAMVTGAPPFAASIEDRREAHLHKAPQPLTQLSNRLATFVNQMLRKSPESRPTLERCVALFSEPEMPAASPARAGLEAAAQLVAIEMSAAEAAKREELARDKEWDRIVQEGTSELEAMRKRLINAICQISSDAYPGDRHVALGSGRLVFGRIERLERGENGGPNLAQSGWTVAAWSTLEAESRTGTQYSYGATLAYGRTQTDRTFRWREASFYRQFGSGSTFEPFALSAGSGNFDMAFANIVADMNVAFGPVAIDGEDEDQFQERWMTLLSRAAVGRLSRPMRLPLLPEFFAP